MITVAFLVDLQILADYRKRESKWDGHTGDAISRGWL